MKNKKAVSDVVATVIMIGLVLAVTVIVWVVVQNVIQGRLSGIESCFGGYEKVTINKLYTCYNSNIQGDPNAVHVQFSINVGDIELDALVISISGDARTHSVTLTNEDNSFPPLKYFGSPNFGGDIKLPNKNSGRTYVLNGTNIFAKKPDLIQIAPIIKGTQCDVFASLSEIEDCRTSG